MLNKDVKLPEGGSPTVAIFAILLGRILLIITLVAALLGWALIEGIRWIYNHVDFSVVVNGS